jgi:hypothetical protein
MWPALEVSLFLTEQNQWFDGQRPIFLNIFIENRTIFAEQPILVAFSEFETV